MRNPFSICNVDCLLDTVTALVSDCDHESLKRLKNIEQYASKCKYTVILNSFFYILFNSIECFVVFLFVLSFLNERFVYTKVQ